MAPGSGDEAEDHGMRWRRRWQRKRQPETEATTLDLTVEDVVDVSRERAPDDLDMSGRSGELYWPKLLLVNEDDRDSLREVLQLGGWDVRHAWTAAHALDIASTWQPDLIMLSQQLPDSTGIAAAQALRERHPAVYLMLISEGPGEVLDVDAEALEVRTVPKIEREEIVRFLITYRDMIVAYERLRYDDL